MLRKIRITLALMFFFGITAIFLDFTGTVHCWLGWMAKIQFLPAVLALNVGIIIALIALTLIFGRIYCSVICPLGVMQDIVSWLSSRRRRMKYRFSYSPQLKWLRYTVVVLFVIAFVASVGSFVALVAPYSAYGRIAQNLFAPLYQWGNNLLAYLAERADSYSFYSTEVWIRSIPTFVIAALTFVVLFVIAWRSGRTYCNTICPVGTVLGFMSRYSFFKLRIDESKCVNCGLCSRQCKASCIDGKNHTIDYSRCVTCMDCIGACTHNAISYAPPRKVGTSDVAANNQHTTAKADSKPGYDAARRNFITVTAITAAGIALKAKEKKVDGGLAVIEDKKVPSRKTPVVPAGALSLKHMAQHCTACQLCVGVCPEGILRPSTDALTFMQPRLEFENGFCRTSCNKCSQVCPTGAIRPISLEEKTSVRIGHAVWIRQNCLVLTEGVTCGNCARHCPAGAIVMVPSDPQNSGSPKVPAVNPEKCIGCGKCEYVCPARPFSAIYVEGNSVHSLK